MTVDGTKIRSRAIVALGAVALMAVASPAIAQRSSTPARILDGSQIRRLLVGKELGAVNAHGLAFVEKFHPDGSASVIFLRKGQQRPAAQDRGRWRISRNRMCLRWHKLMGGKEHCWGVLQEGDRYRQVQVRLGLPFSVRP